MEDVVTPSLPPRLLDEYNCCLLFPGEYVSAKKRSPCVAELHVDVVLGPGKIANWPLFLAGGSSGSASSHHSSPATPLFSSEHALTLKGAIRRANVACAVA